MIDALIQTDIQKIKSVVATDRFENKQVLITGGAGFIGSWLSDVLTESGAEVTIVDNFSTGRARNIDHLQTNKKIRLIEKTSAITKPTKNLK